MICLERCRVVHQALPLGALSRELVVRLSLVWSALPMVSGVVIDDLHVDTDFFVINVVDEVSIGLVKPVRRGLILVVAPDDP